MAIRRAARRQPAATLACCCCCALLLSVVLAAALPGTVGQQQRQRQQRRLAPHRKAGDVISPCQDPGVPYTLQTYKNATGRFREITVTVPGPAAGAEADHKSGDTIEVTCGVILPASRVASASGGGSTNAAHAGAHAAEVAEVFPTILALPGGPQQLFNWDDWAARYFEHSELAGGSATASGAPAGLGTEWMVVAPIAPEHAGLTFFSDAGARLVPAIFLAAQEALQFRAEDGQFHCVGNSNGGVSCFHAALAAPDLVASITAHTGFALDALRLGAAEAAAALRPLLPIPIVMHVGDQDCFRFHTSMARTRTVLEQLHHPDIEFHLYPGVGHFNVVSDVIADAPCGRLAAGWEWLAQRRRTRRRTTSPGGDDEL